MKTKPLKLTEIVIDSKMQVRAEIDAKVVDEYAQEMQESPDKFPPVVVFRVRKQYLLADGFHRVQAAKLIHSSEIEADVREGTRAAALKYALSANAAHGLRRTNADKRRSVELALAQWPDLSSREIAKIAAVNNHLVDDVRQPKLQLGETPSSQTRVGADGKERRMPKRKARAIASAPQSAKAPPEPPAAIVTNEGQAREPVNVPQMKKAESEDHPVVATDVKEATPQGCPPEPEAEQPRVRSADEILEDRARKATREWCLATFPTREERLLAIPYITDTLLQMKVEARK